MNELHYCPIAKVHCNCGEPKQGEWIRKMYDGWECSSCHKMQYTMDIESYHYCRFCGSRMKGGDEK